MTDTDSILSTLREFGCRQIIVSAEDAREQQICDLIRGMIGSDITVAVIPSLTGLPLFGITTNYLFGQDLLLLQLRNNLARVPSRLMKRIVDLLGPIAIIILSSPIWLVIIAAIKLHDNGPVFYWQRRVGRDGRMFKCIKFRTMAVDADQRLEEWRRDNPALYTEFLKSFKLRDDPRVTKPGKWLRRTSLDELPQLLNVLAGDMSLVGPRPVPLEQLHEQYGRAAQLYLQVRPGLTGLWQVSGRSDTSGAERVVYDEWYILNWSVWYDFVILIQTVRVVLTARGAY
jgi:Undecaprenyl-phosphate galactose phosphotransferase WbaP